MRKPSNIKELFNFFGLIIPRVGSFLNLFICFLLVVFLNSQNIVSQGIRKAGNETAGTVLEFYKIIFDLIPDFPYMVGKYADIVNENSKLKSENYDLHNKSSYLEVMLAEQKALNKDLNFSSPEKFQTAAFRVSSVDISGLKHYISVLSNGDIKFPIGSAVIYNNTLIGKLVSVDENLMHIQLITDVNFKVSTMTMESQRRCMVKGRGLPGKLHATCLDSDARYYDGDEKLITAGNDGAFPYGIIVGIIYAKDDEFKVDVPNHVPDLRFVQIAYNSNN